MSDADRRRHEAEVEARRLEAAHRGGDVLALYELCSYWRRQNLAASCLPAWALDHLADTAACYYDTGPFASVTPAAYVAMSDTKARDAVTPSLDKIAGLRGDKGRDNAWLKRAKVARYPFLIARYKDLLARARAGSNEYAPPAGPAVPILDRRGRVTRAFKNAIARTFKLPGWEKKQSDMSRTLGRILADHGDN